MINVNIRRAVENTRSGTTVYTPVVEAIVNGIQAILPRQMGESRPWLRGKASKSWMAQSRPHRASWSPIRVPGERARQ